MHCGVDWSVDIRRRVGYGRMQKLRWPIVISPSLGFGLVWTMDVWNCKCDNGLLDIAKIRITPVPTIALQERTIQSGVNGVPALPQREAISIPAKPDDCLKRPDADRRSDLQGGSGGHRVTGLSGK